jgi:hypothetical protein
MMRLLKMSADVGFASTVFHSAQGWAAKGNDVYVFRKRACPASPSTRFERERDESEARDERREERACVRA